MNTRKHSVIYHNHFLIFYWLCKLSISACDVLFCRWHCQDLLWFLHRPHKLCRISACCFAADIFQDLPKYLHISASTAQALHSLCICADTFCIYWHQDLLWYLHTSASTSQALHDTSVLLLHCILHEHIVSACTFKTCFFGFCIQLQPAQALLLWRWCQHFAFSTLKTCTGFCMTASFALHCFATGDISSLAA